eukprot:TRINITY_DN18993_c4_g1_i1.p1 TRINITY_DN18993_c4_g1~~TRINITY_DN18993_c4_g1_i1.p1  ORF type:complete len:454 (-),score=83.17 TRINITY_DN18993_c4_g1_i1:233-1594(-)
MASVTSAGAAVSGAAKFDGGDGGTPGGGYGVSPVEPARPPNEMCCRREEEEDEDEDDSEDEDDPDSDCSSDDNCREGDMDNQERQHFLDVCWSLMDYKRDASYDVKRLQDQLASLDPLDAALWKADPSLITQMAAGVEINSRFLELLPCPEVCATNLGPNGNSIVTQVPPTHRVASRNSSKVRSTLRQFVRDWAVEGEAEREASYAPMMQALMRHMPPPKPTKKQDGRSQTGRRPTVLCPGCGLGRLPFDLVRLGYAAQGNEFSYHMLLGSCLVLNRSPRQGCHVIFPFVLSTTNRRQTHDHLAPVRIPDVCPCQVLGADAELSMAAGEFVQVYHEQEKEWDAVLTCFFLDTAKNVFIYIRTIAQIIRPGGLWINLGPLLYHYAEMPNEVSVELSWEEVKPAILRYFDLIEEEERFAHYTTNPNSLMGVKYKCKFFVAIRNSVEASGVSNPVF